jgi:hypothetical protein
MGIKAEEFGVEIYPGFAASEVQLVWLSYFSQQLYHCRNVFTSYAILPDLI